MYSTLSWHQIETGRSPESQLPHVWRSIWLPPAQGVCADADADNKADADADNETDVDNETDADADNETDADAVNEIDVDADTM